MQGLILSAYPHLDVAAYLLYRIDDADATRQWLRHIVDRVTPGLNNKNADTDLNINIALSHTGLEKLVDVTGQAAGSFASPFAEGMAGRAHRSRILGDTGPSDPRRWEWGGVRNPVDLLLMVFARNEEGLAEAVAIAGPPAAALPPVAALPSLSLKEAGNTEHFGFRDGISQPILTGTPDAERYPESKNLTQLGEIVFGYPDGNDEIARGPSLHDNPDFGRNGTHLVFRQLDQDVAAFWNVMCEKTTVGGKADLEAARQLASKIVGRNRDGTPLVPRVNREDNEFDFTGDRHGYGCPIGAHIRRSNPRNSFADAPGAPLSANRHRVVRRGRSYGDKLPAEACGVRDDGERRGLLFLCLNADLERQFEFINQNWVNNSGFLGLAGERDPLVGDRPADGRTRFTVPGLPAPSRIHGLPRFVTVRGGEYFFLPGLRALRYLGGAR